MSVFGHNDPPTPRFAPVDRFEALHQVAIEARKMLAGRASSLVDAVYALDEIEKDLRVIR